MWSAIGLSLFDIAVYRQLLRDPTTSVGDHADLLHASAADVDRALGHLHSVGLLRRGERDVLTPVEPKSGLAALVRTRQTALDSITALSAQLAREFTAGQLRSAPDRLVEVVTGRPAIESRIEDLLVAAKREAVGTDTPPYVAGDSDRVQKAQTDLLMRGARFRSIYATEGLNSPELINRLTTMIGHGEQARVLSRPPVKLLVVDAATAVLPLASGTRADAGDVPGAVIVTDSALTDALQALFEMMWERALPVKRRDGGLVTVTGGETGDDTVLVGLLAAGMKDEAIARQLGISPRTFRRRVSALQDRLGAETRFQAGVQAARAGRA